MTNARMAASIILLIALILNCSYLIKAQEPQHWRTGTPICTYWSGPPITDTVATQMAEGGFNLIWCSEKEMDVACPSRGADMWFQEIE